MSEFILEMTNISKSFGPIQVLHDISFKVKRGSVCALMGENGAGKSTLMKILIGLEKPDEGTVVFDGNDITGKSLQNTIASGISMIHQELSPVLDMTVAENIFLGHKEAFKNGFLQRKKIIAGTKQLFERLQIDIDPNAYMRSLSVAECQMVEIAKALSYDAKLIVMDEPTSAISEKETQQLFNIMRSLRGKVTFIYITHPLKEVWEIADEYVVIRDGHYIGTRVVQESSVDELVRMMAGRELGQIFNKPETELGDVVLEVDNLTVNGQFSNVSFSLRKGEILGIAGLVGSGRTEILECIYGLTKPDSGSIRIKGEEAHLKGPEDAIKRGIGIITEDRKRTGLFLPLSIKENMQLLNIDKYLKCGLLNEKEAAKDCDSMVERLRIKNPGLAKAVKSLSGGNQQKVLVARLLLKDPDIILLDEPTRGIDINAKKEIYSVIFELAKMGKAIIVVASEMEIVMGLSDRLFVMHLGKQMGELSKDEMTQERIMTLAGGIVDAEADAGHAET